MVAYISDPITQILGTCDQPGPAYLTSSKPGRCPVSKKKQNKMKHSPKRYTWLCFLTLVLQVLHSVLFCFLIIGSRDWTCLHACTASTLLTSYLPAPSIKLYCHHRHLGSKELQLCSSIYFWHRVSLYSPRLVWMFHSLYEYMGHMYTVGIEPSQNLALIA